MEKKTAQMTKRLRLWRRGRNSSSVRGVPSGWNAPWAVTICDVAVVSNFATNVEVDMAIVRV